MIQRFSQSNLTGLVYLLIIYSGLLSCCTNTGNKSIGGNKSSLNNLQQLNLAGQIYVFGSNLDTINCKAYGECDCCSGDIQFLNDSIFIGVDYCGIKHIYYKGSYEVMENTVSFHCDSLRVDRDKDHEKNKQASFLHKRKDVAASCLWTRFDCQDKICFLSEIKETPYSTPSDKSQIDFIQDLKQTGIWSLLELNNIFTE